MARATLIIVILLAAVLHQTHAKTVGVKWIIAPSIKSGLDMWRTYSSKRLYVCYGDYVRFDWRNTGGYHGVYRAKNSTYYGSCNRSGGVSMKANAYNTYKTVGPYASSTTKYYFCSAPGHCAAGQKMRVTWKSCPTAAYGK